MNCPSCGGVLEGDVQFCPYCGMRLTTSSAGMPTTRVGSAERETPAYIPPPLPPATPLDQPQYQSPGYAMPTYSEPISAPMSNAATVSLVFGILGLIILPVIAPVVAVVAGHMARREIANSGGRLAGSGRATAGLVLGYVQIALTILGCFLFFLIAIASTSAGGS